MFILFGREGDCKNKKKFFYLLPVPDDDYGVVCVEILVKKGS